MKRHPFTNRFAAATLVAITLFGCAPIAAQATEAPTASASATATATATATAVRVGAGEVIAVKDARISNPGGTGAIGALAPGERAKWTAFLPDGSGGQYTVTTALGLQGEVTGDSVVAIPQAGLALDQHYTVRNAVGRADVMDGFGGVLGAGSMDIRKAPAEDGEVISRATVGQKLLGSKLIEGESNLMGQTMYVAVLLNADTQEYGWLISEAIELDPDPTAPETLAAPEPVASSEPAESSNAPTAEATEEVTELSASPTAEATTQAATETVAAPAAGKFSGTTVLTTGGVGLIAGALIGAAAARRKKPAKHTDNAPAAPSEDEAAGSATGDVSDVVVEDEAAPTKITWG